MFNTKIRTDFVPEYLSEADVLYLHSFKQKHLSINSCKQLNYCIVISEIVGYFVYFSLETKTIVKRYAFVRGSQPFRFYTNGTWSSHTLNLCLFRSKIFKIRFVLEAQKMTEISKKAPSTSTHSKLFSAVTFSDCTPFVQKSNYGKIINYCWNNTFFCYAQNLNKKQRLFCFRKTVIHFTKNKP